MKRLASRILAAALASTLALVGCAAPQEQPTAEGTAQAEDAPKDEVANATDMAEPVELDVEGLEPITAGALVEGTYPIEVDSSSSMFRIVSCELNVIDGAMTARMTMGGKGYLYVYSGTAEEAAAASEEDLIPFEEDGDAHVFTIPVEALNKPVPCAAYSKKKEMWYDRDLVFRADSLPAEAFADGMGTSLEDLGLEDGSYTVNVTLEGGSGRATVDSPARLVVSDGKAVAHIVWSSPNYDYMLVDGERLEPINAEGNSEFEVPVAGFDYAMPVTADTTAMSKPHEIDYTLNFDSSTVSPANV